MALSTSMVWELRDSGSDSNGGGFKTGASGTDYSKQNSPQYALTGVTSAGAGNTVLTASAAADMVGNVGQVISGTNFTTGWFEVLSVVAGVSITFSTNQAGASICTGVGASGVINIGGGLLTWATLFSTPVMAAGHNAWVKGTFTITSALVISFQAGTGGGAVQSVVQGYTTVRGDSGHALLTTATNSIDLVDFTTTYGILFRQIDSSSTAGTRGNGWVAKTGANSAAVHWERCVFDGLGKAVLGNWSTAWAFVSIYFRDCVFKNCITEGGENSGFTVFDGCRFTNNGANGWRSISSSPQGGPVVAINTIFDNNGAAGLALDATDTPTTLASGCAVVKNCVFVSNGTDGIAHSGSGPYAAIYENNIFYGNSGFGINSPGTGFIVGGTNAFGANVSGPYGNGAQALPGDVTLSADPFTNKAAGDFSLNSNAGGGSACRSAGWPGVLQSGGTGHADIGALEPSAGGGGGGSTYVVVKKTIQFLGKQGDY